MAKPKPRRRVRRPDFTGESITAFQLLLRTYKIPLSLVAADVGVSVSHCSNVSAGTVNPSAAVRRRIERLLGRRWSWLMRPANEILEGATLTGGSPSSRNPRI
jgi:transcriptional regulator with XRE-family HTH domain